MSEQQVRGDRAVYDHETETGTGRRRNVADWGVGEEIFDRLPRRRFGRAGEPLRRESHPRAAAVDAPAPAASAPEASRRDEPRDVEPRPEARRVERRDQARSPQPRSRAATARPAVRGGASDGRRTIVIGRSNTSAALERRRPPRTVGERIGHRPDRLAMWAFALGMLLILIAILTANA